MHRCKPIGLTINRTRTIFGQTYLAQTAKTPSIDLTIGQTDLALAGDVAA
jgi:hypothetical protein